jgi:hypothetical protein
MQILVLATIGFLVWATRMAWIHRHHTGHDYDVARIGFSFLLTVGSFTAVGVLMVAVFGVS